ncbi:hypothetical protein [Roseimaritima ulvae]|uniref:Uncharacterized protein n=1 Tax=Roseimaritima ulvae TaxID=980254 RepID=A0A5B9QW48_9BACT|nr:hypothetical protein [Roseimaritima ulvae]QEG43278.1 hypothetical protein UC8_53250 [Roseimaritima ulvae]
MMFAARPVWLVLTALVLTCCSGSTADAQFLRIGPLGGVRLRLPMVSVDVGPGGATRVRAPFTAVDTPGYPYGSPYYGPAYPAVRAYPAGPSVVVGRPAFAVPSPAVPNPAPSASSAAADQLSDQQLLQELAAAGNALARALATRQGGDVWVDYLRPHDLADLTSGGDTATLTRLLRGYEGVQANSQLTWLNRVTGFTTTQTLLRQWLSRQAGQSPTGQPTPAMPPTPAVPPQPSADPASSAEPTPAVPPQPGAEPTRAIPPQPAGDTEAAEAIPTPAPEPTSIRIEA